MYKVKHTHTMSVTLLRSRLMSNFASALNFWLSSFNVNIKKQKNKAYIKQKHVLCRMVIEIHTFYLPVVYSVYAPALFSFSKVWNFREGKEPNWTSIHFKLVLLLCGQTGFVLNFVFILIIEPKTKDEIQV